MNLDTIQGVRKTEAGTPSHAFRALYHLCRSLVPLFIKKSAPKSVLRPCQDVLGFDTDRKQV